MTIKYFVINNSVILLGQSDPYTLTPQDIGNWVTLKLINPISVAPAGVAYLAAVHGVTHPIDTSLISSSGSDGVVSFVQDNGCNIGSGGLGYWYSLSKTLMIRMNLGQVNLPANVSEEFFAGNLEIFPNPSTGSFLLEMSGVENDIYNVEVTNLLGEQVYLSQHRISNSYIKQNINLVNYPQGTYLINISNSSNTITEKLIIH